MKRALGILALGVLVIAGGATNAAALELTPADTTCTYGVNSNLNGSQVLGIVDACFDADATVLNLLYKANVPDDDGDPVTEEGTFASSYNTVFMNTSTDPEDATISYISGPIISCVECYLVVKDGNHNPAQYFFDLSGWDGVEAIELTGFWPNGGAISNIAIWGGPGASVPEPGSLLLLGTGFALAVIRRRRHTA